jgi:hypothetical protein
MVQAYRDLSERQKFRAQIRGVILAFAAVSTYAFAVLVQQKLYVWSLIPAVILGLLSILEFVVADFLVDSRFPLETTLFLERLRRKLSTTSTNNDIVRALNDCVASFTACDKGRITSAVHLLVDLIDPGTYLTTPGLVQISDYSRSGLGGPRWRTLKATQGLVGRCVRADQMVYVNFPTPEEYTRRMVEEFGFTQAEAASHTKDARSYLAVPIRNGDNLIGVMYFFSTEAQVFPRAVDETDVKRYAEHVAALLRASEII